MNKAGEMHSYSASDKLPESTRDKLPESVGEIDSTLLGRLLNCTGEMAPLGCLVFRRGTILYFCRGILRLSGMLAEEHLYTPLGNIEIFWGYPTSLRLIIVLLEESILLAVSLSGEFKMPGYVL